MKQTQRVLNRSSLSQTDTTIFHAGPHSIDRGLRVLRGFRDRLKLPMSW
jgi:hypothetical protein